MLAQEHVSFSYVHHCKILLGGLNILLILARGSNVNLNVRHLNDIVIVVLFKNTTNEQCTTHVYLQNKTDKSKNHSGNGAVHKLYPELKACQFGFCLDGSEIMFRG